MIEEKINPYFVMELKTGFVVIGDHQYFKGYTLFYVSNMLLSCISYRRILNFSF